jgi:hypothetical protein
VSESAVQSRLTGDAVQELRSLDQVMSALPRQPEPNTKQFRADTAGNARRAAAAWLSDFNSHGPLHIESIKTTAHERQFLSVVTYWPQ